MKSTRPRAEFNANAAGGIVMDVNTGEVLAMVSLPDFDPNAASLRTGGNSDRNIMAADVYELGSVFKIFAFALAMEDHTIRLDEMFPIGSGFKHRQIHHPRSRAHAGHAGGARYPGPVLQHRHRADRAALRRRAPAGTSCGTWAC